MPEVRLVGPNGEQVGIVRIEDALRLAQEADLHVSRFLGQGHKVKVTIMFRGREQSRPELGFRLLQRLAEDVSDLGFIEAKPKQDGRNMIMVLAPHKNNKKSKANAS